MPPVHTASGGSPISRRSISDVHRNLASVGRQLPRTIGSVDIDDLPLARAEIELSEADSELVVVGGSGDPSMIMVLVRLHTHPIGMCVVDGTIGRSSRMHRAAIWQQLGDAINGHLAADGLAPADSADALASMANTQEIPWCVRRRSEVLADPPLISVVVATRDRPETLRTCLDALLLIEYPDYEIVVVDNDPSNDETAELVANSFGSLVSYVREDRRGLAAAHNCGLARARGEIIAFVDDDVLVDRHWLTAIAEGFAADDGVGCVTGLILPEQLETQAQLLREQHGGFGKGFERRTFGIDRNRPTDPLFPFTAGQLGSGANMAFDTEKLRGMNGFDTALGIGTFARGGDDLAAFFRIVVAGHQLVYQPSSVVWHRHPRDMGALRGQANGYGVGLGAFLASSLVKEPHMLAPLLRRIPAGLAHVLGPTSIRNGDPDDGWPPDLLKLEKRGLLWGPIAYAVSRWRAWRAPVVRGAELRQELSAPRLGREVGSDPGQARGTWS